MIKIEQLKKLYKGTEVVNIPELTILEGEVIGLVGNNGAGKTTLFQLLLDFIPASAGSAFIKGQNVKQSNHFSPFTAAYLDEHFLIEFLTAEEFFYFVGDARNVSKADVNELLAQFEDVFHGEVLGKRKYLRNFSKGNQKKVGLISTLIGNPELIFWDEPFANLDPRTQLKIKEIVQAYSDQRTWIISSHDLGHIVDVCTRIIILEKGNITHDIQRAETSLEELTDLFRQ